MMEQKLDIIEGLIEVSATCITCKKVVSALADPGRFPQFLDKVNDPDGHYGPYYCAMEVWSESSHWYRELMQAYLIKDYQYYCDNDFNSSYPNGIDDSGAFKHYQRMRLFHEMSDDRNIPRESAHSAYDEKVHLVRKELYKRASEIIYGGGE
tara:strand:+ start:281 stop:736 length:456 start_codon:yes stop_codon:yes gene_type:complete